VGGGARSRAWNQIKADVLGVPYQPLKRNEFGTWGSAMIAGRAAGIFADLAETAYVSAEANGPAVCPQPEVVSVYSQLAEKYVGWQHTLSDAFRRLTLV